METTVPVIRDTEKSLAHVEVNSKEPTEVVSAQSDVVSHRSLVPHLLWMHLTGTKRYYFLVC